MLHKDDALLGMTTVPQCHRNSKNIQLSQRPVLLRWLQVAEKVGKVGQH
jgi:hypothetical protein